MKNEGRKTSRRPPLLIAHSLLLIMGNHRPLFLILVQELAERGHEDFLSFVLAAGPDGQKRFAHFPEVLLQLGSLTGNAVADEEAPELRHADAPKGWTAVAASLKLAPR